MHNIYIHKNTNLREKIRALENPFRMPHIQLLGFSNGENKDKREKIKQKNNRRKIHRCKNMNLQTESAHQIHD